MINLSQLTSLGWATPSRKDTGDLSVAFNVRPKWCDEFCIWISLSDDRDGFLLQSRCVKPTALHLQQLSSPWDLCSCAQRTHCPTQCISIPYHSKQLLVRIFPKCFSRKPQVCCHTKQEVFFFFFFFFFPNFRDTKVLFRVGDTPDIRRLPKITSS